MPFAFFVGHTSKILITFHLLQLCPLHAIIISRKISLESAVHFSSKRDYSLIAEEYDIPNMYLFK